MWNQALGRMWPQAIEVTFTCAVCSRDSTAASASAYQRKKTLIGALASSPW
jgi:hypothetical protein